MLSVTHIRTVTLWTVLALFSCSNLSAQRYTFRQYGPSEGLTNLTVHCLMQDRTGYIWVGTDNGLFRYDGGVFQKFGHAEGLPSDEIRGLAESPEGVLWAATTGGVARLVGRQFRQVEVGEKGQFREIVFDSLGRLYIKHVSGLVLGISDGAGSYRFRTVVRGAIRGLSAQGEDVWYGEDGDLWRLTGDKAARAGTPSGLPKDHWDAIAKDSLGNLWVRSSTRLYELPYNQLRFSDRSDGIPHAPNAHLYADRHGRLFAPSVSGVMVLDGANQTHLDSKHGLMAGAMGPVSSIARGRYGWARMAAAYFVGSDMESGPPGKWKTVSCTIPFGPSTAIAMGRRGSARARD